MATRRLIAFVVVGLAVLAAPAAAMAQRWGRERVPHDGACFYRDADYSGEYFCVRAGDGFSSMPGDMNDNISSIRIFGRAEVFVFRDRHYDGKSARFEMDVRNLKHGGWNDRISSLRVDSLNYGGYRPEHRGGDPDRIVRRAYEDVLHREPDTAGLRLYRSRIVDDGWSEAQVRDALRNSPEYRQQNTMTYPKAQEIVRQAYLSVLGREPDPGSRGYVDHVMRDHWSQGDVERELRKSAEYRNKRR
jgi:Peptidase inhibitor family I36